MPAVKNVGEPCAGKPHARFDGGREETNVSRLRRATPGASRLPDIKSGAAPIGRPRAVISPSRAVVLSSGVLASGTSSGVFPQEVARGAFEYSRGRGEVAVISGLAALEVLVGLSFVFFLLSTACSAVQETLAGILGWRAKTLEDAVSNMLGNPKVRRGAGRRNGGVASTVAASARKSGRPMSASSCPLTSPPRSSRIGGSEGSSEIPTRRCGVAAAPHICPRER